MLRGKLETKSGFKDGEKKRRSCPGIHNVYGIKWNENEIVIKRRLGLNASVEKVKGVASSKKRGHDHPPGQERQNVDATRIRLEKKTYTNEASV